MQQLRSLLLPLLIITHLIPVTTTADTPNLSLEDIFDKQILKPKTLTNIQWLTDSSGYYHTQPDPTNPKNTDLYRYDIQSNAQTRILGATELTFDDKPLHIKRYIPSPNNQYLLLLSNTQKIWRFSEQSEAYLYNLQTRQLTPLANHANNLSNFRFSSNSQHLGYTQNNNLHLLNLNTLKTQQLTQDGTDNILNGVFDWVYEEEFESADAWQWSPDNQKIAYWHTDQTRVKTFTLVDELPTYNKTQTLKYPKAGEQNAITKIGVLDLQTRTTQWIDTGDNDDTYLPRINWTPDAQHLIIQHLNRRQNHLQYLLADIRTGKTKTIAEEHSKAWIDITDDTYPLHNHQLLWTAETSGYRHLYLTDYHHNTTQQITHGDWEISKISIVDEKNHRVYFHGKKDSVIEQHLYRVSLQNHRIQKTSQNLGYYQANYSPNPKYLIQTASSSQIPPQISLRHADGQLIRTLQNNDQGPYQRYTLNHPEYLTIKTPDGLTLNAQITKPSHFNPKKKYPVIVYAYGGPGSQQVLNNWNQPQSDWSYYLTQQNYILFTLDNRGTGGRGTHFKHYAYGDFARWAVQDQIQGIQYLRSLPYIDPQRIGFWGKSFGGYMAGLLMTRASDYYTTGIALAMVSDYNNYDTIWTERYLGLPSDNPEGYKAVNVIPQTHNLKGNLFLIHGSGDDNVHIQNTFQWAETLIAQNKPFQLMIYPNRNHSLTGGNTRLHLHTLMTQYFNQHLKNTKK